MKVVGRRRLPTSTSAANVLLKTVLQLRGRRGVAPKGVYRFRSFEEAQAWMMQKLVESSLETPR